MRMSAFGRYCCKSLFALRIKNSAGCGCDFHVKMWGTSSPGDKLMGDLGNVIEVTQIGGRRSDCLMARKLSSSNFGLLQQYLPKADSCAAANRTLSLQGARAFPAPAVGLSFRGRAPLVHLLMRVPRYGHSLRTSVCGFKPLGGHSPLVRNARR